MCRTTKNHFSCCSQTYRLCRQPCAGRECKCHRICVKNSQRFSISRFQNLHSSVWIWPHLPTSHLCCSEPNTVRINSYSCPNNTLSTYPSYTLTINTFTYHLSL